MYIISWTAPATTLHLLDLVCPSFSEVLLWVGEDLTSIRWSWIVKRWSLFHVCQEMQESRYLKQELWVLNSTKSWCRFNCHLQRLRHHNHVSVKPLSSKIHQDGRWLQLSLDDLSEVLRRDAAAGMIWIPEWVGHEKFLGLNFPHASSPSANWGWRCWR